MCVCVREILIDFIQNEYYSNPYGKDQTFVCELNANHCMCNCFLGCPPLCVCVCVCVCVYTRVRVCRKVAGKERDLMTGATRLLEKRSEITLVDKRLKTHREVLRTNLARSP